MEKERIQAPDGVARLVKELWLNHPSGNRSNAGQMFMVDLPEPTEEEKRIMAANRAARKPFVIDENELKDALQKAAGELGGW